MDLVEAIVDGFRRAAVGMTTWEAALTALSEPAGARAAQLGGFDDHGTLILNVMLNVSSEEVAAYYTHGGADMAINVRNRAVSRARPFACLTEEDFATPAMVTSSPIYRDLFIPFDVQHACMARLNVAPHRPTAVALLRPRARGHADNQTRRLVEAVAPGLADAVQTAGMLNAGTEAAMLQTAELLAGPSILLGPGLTIVSLSPAAETLLRTGEHLTIRGGRLIAAASNPLLDRAFATVTAPNTLDRRIVRLVVHGSTNGEPLPCELVPLPVRCTGPLSQACALLTLSRPPDPSSEETLAVAFGLTPAEAAIGALLAQGLDLQQIGARRGSAISTVRNQVKALLAKTDTRRQAELVIKLRRF